MNDQVADAAIQNNFRRYRQRGNESTLLFVDRLDRGLELQILYRG